MAGRVVETIERKRVGGRVVEKVKEETVGGILHWGRENDPDLAWFREEIRKAYGGRAPKVLDPFAGGGAIPLEAMRLGCDVTAMDINPVAWFILKCTLEYPQKLAGQTRSLPEFALEDGEFMEAFLKAKGFKGASLRTFLERLGHGDGGDIQLDLLQQDDPILEADLAWHVRAWGRWVLAKARTELAAYYPTYAGFEPLKLDEEYEPRPIRLLEVDDAGVPQVDPLNAEFDDAYLKDPRNPRWIAKPTVAYLWARTVTCKQCRATLPLLKTRWLCKKDRKRVLLTMEPKADQTGVVLLAIGTLIRSIRRIRTIESLQDDGDNLLAVAVMLAASLDRAINYMSTLCIWEPVASEIKQTCHAALQPSGRLIVVFANKQPDAWETLVSAIIRAGFVVDGSWPIATEMRGGVRNYGRASLASSIWIVCKKRPPARPGWDTTVLNEMRDNITQQLRDFWDAGIRGPDFVWAATGPASTP